MIAEAEIRRAAALEGVDPMVIDLDYSQSWFLLGLSHHDKLAAALRFKGGTCLRKCYFPEYRFSEDLDFTMETTPRFEELENGIQQIIHWLAGQDAPDFQVAPPRFEVVNDDDSHETYQARLYYRGPLRWGGSPRTIRLDLTRFERLALPSVMRRIFHPYTDQSLFQDISLACYSLEEVLAEKLRAVVGQRRFAVSRDLYDISHLFRAGADVAMVQAIFPDKAQARGISCSDFSLTTLESRKGEYRLDWERRLRYLVREGTIGFDVAWKDLIEILREVLS